MTILCLWFCLGAFKGAQAADIECDDQIGPIGSLIFFDVWIVSSPHDVASFGFSLVYDPNILVYRDYVEGSLVSGFDFLGVNQLVPGVVKVGGFCAGDGPHIRAMDTGSIVSIQFEVVGHGDCSIHIRGLKDDMAGWSTRSGYFTGDHADEQGSDGAGDASQTEPATTSGGTLSIQSESPAVTTRAKTRYAAVPMPDPRHNQTDAVLLKEPPHPLPEKKDSNEYGHALGAPNKEYPTHPTDQQVNGQDFAKRKQKANAFRTFRRAQTTIADPRMASGSTETQIDTTDEAKQPGNFCEESLPTRDRKSFTQWVFPATVVVLLLFGLCLCILAAKIQKS